MKPRFIFLFISLFLTLQIFAQTYILNEDFSGTSGTNPPAGWSNTVITGTNSDLWHFDNPGKRIINFPILHPFAIFDSEAVSANGQPEESVLETPLFDASASNFILLHFDHTFEPGTGGVATIQVYDGNDWNDVASFTAATPNSTAALIDLSPYIGGITTAKVRFTWTGNDSGYWAVDNIRIYASLALDAGVVSIDNPTIPVTPGLQDVEITLGNFGYNTITSTTIDWTVDDIPQASYNWNGSIAVGQTQSGVIIGNHNFQGPVIVKVWQSNPNGQTDPNPFNDTITKYLTTPLCGTYTIGGSNPDFNSFADAAFALNAAGVNCGVVFKVRDGNYNGNVYLGEIQGTSATSRVIFESESGNPENVKIFLGQGSTNNDAIFTLEGSAYLSFKNLWFETGNQSSISNQAFMISMSNHIVFDGCHLELNKTNDIGTVIKAQSHDITIENCEFSCNIPRAKAIQVKDQNTQNIEIINNEISGGYYWENRVISLENKASQVNIEGNYIHSAGWAIYLTWTDQVNIENNEIASADMGVFIDNQSTNTSVSANRIISNTNSEAPDGTAAIWVNKATATSIFNNYLTILGDYQGTGINLVESSQCSVHFNSVNLASDDGRGSGRALNIHQTDEISGRNNIFFVKSSGIPISIDAMGSQTDLDHNNYFSYSGPVGELGDAKYYGIQDWIDATGMDNSSLSEHPFFSDDLLLSMNQILLNNAGVPVSGITTDIDGTTRHPVTPDIGAKEYEPCNIDAGINAIVNPENPLSAGNHDVRVILQNQGNAVLTSATVHWSVNGLSQSNYLWNGNLNSGVNQEITIGNYLFASGGTYLIKAWTSQPNGSTDCNHNNDTILSQELAAPLCGSYTIGGASPDFNTINEAVSILNLAGITCAVDFYIRPGEYQERIVIGEISGSSAINTVTFRSESGDSTSVTLRSLSDAPKFEPVVHMTGSQNVFFRNVGFRTGSQFGNTNYAMVMDGVSNCGIQNSLIMTKNSFDLGIIIQKGSSGVSIENCNLDCDNKLTGALMIRDEGTNTIEIKNNHISGPSEWGYNSIEVASNASQVLINNNHIEEANTSINISSCDNVEVSQNSFDNINYGVFVLNSASNIAIEKNKINNVISNSEAPQGTNGIYAKGVSQVNIVNNFITTSGNGPVSGIYIANSTTSSIYFNSINLGNDDPTFSSRGLYMSESSGIIVKNNISNINISGIPVYLGPGNQLLEFDHNNYYSFDHTIGYFESQIYKELTEWINAVNMDESSLSENPFFNSHSDLTMNQILLNDSGLPISGVTDDIDGTPRDPSSPDIGAREYDPCTNDAGINAILNPTNPISFISEDVIVVLQNHGISNLTDAEIHWTVNNEVQTEFSWTGSLSQGMNEEVSIGTYDFEPGKAYILKIWTDSPNGTTDCNHYNDTILSQALASPLCGDYTIGGANPDFINFTEAASVLNNAGITCSVRFFVREGTYQENFNLGSISGSSEDNTVTFLAENGDSSTTILQIDPNTPANEPMILMENANHIHFNNLGFSTGSTIGYNNFAFLLIETGNIYFNNCYFTLKRTTDLGLIATDYCHHITVNECHFKSINNQATAINISGQGTNNIVVKGCQISGAPTAGYSTIKIGPYTTHIEVSDNILSNCFRAIHLSNADYTEITRNTINNCDYGIVLDVGCQESRITENSLTNIRNNSSLPSGTSGIHIVNGDAHMIYNNFIHASGDAPVNSIMVDGVDSCEIHYNSANITTSDAEQKSRGIYLNDINYVLGRNNICQITTAGIPIHLEDIVTSISLDYNNYYHPTGLVGKIDEQEYSNINEWGSAINGDANSLTVNSFFKEDTLPLPHQRALNGAGIPVAGITHDINGTTRNSQAPDMGCYEFLVDIGITELLSPTLECFQPLQDSVTVYIKKYGDLPFEDIEIALQIDGGPIKIEPIPNTIETDITWTFDTVINISEYGAYFFKVWLIGTLDDNINNDTLAEWRYSSPLPTAFIDWDNFCTGREVHFFGSATIPDPGFIEKYEWLFGDGDTVIGQNPVHTYAEAGTYEVILRAYTDAGCYNDTTESITIEPGFEGLAMELETSEVYCFGDQSGSIEVTASGGYPPYSYYLNGTQQEDESITDLGEGTYVIEVIDSQNCATSDTVSLTTEIHMEPQIFASPLSGDAPLIVEFDFTANGVHSWTWYFPDDEEDTNKVTSHEFVEYGNNIVTLEVNSGPPHYCIETATVQIWVDVEPTIEPNNIFSPNDDGYNDFFTVYTLGIDEITVNIFNLWGNKLYVIDSVGGKWNGVTDSGADAPDGTYFFDLRAIDIYGSLHHLQGTVMLVRHGTYATPNPVEDNVRIKTFNPLNGAVEVRVYSSYGQVVHSEKIADPHNIVINLGHLTAGVYIIKVTDGEQQNFVRIIKH